MEMGEHQSNIDLFGERWLRDKLPSRHGNFSLSVVKKSFCRLNPDSFY